MGAQLYLRKANVSSRMGITTLMRMLEKEGGVLD